MVCFLGSLLLTGTLSAQVYCTSGAFCEDYGFGFSQGISQNVLPIMRRAAAQGAALNNIRALPARMRQPEHFALGVLVGAAGGPYDKSYSKDQFLQGDSNASFRGWPISIPATNGSAYSGMYVYFSADTVGLPKKHTIGVHGSLSNMAYEGDTGFDTLNPIESVNSERISVRTRAIGFRYQMPLVERRGWDYLAWEGLQFQTGLSYSYNKATYRSRYKTREFIYTPGLVAADINSFFRSNYVMESRTNSEIESTNLAMPFEVRSGVRVLFMTLSYAPGVALNYGKHKSRFSMEGAICNNTIGSCSNLGWRLGLIPQAIKTSTGLDSFASILSANDPSSFYVHDEAEIYSEGIFVYHAADLRIHLGYVEWVISATISHEFAQASLAFELDL